MKKPRRLKIPQLENQARAIGYLCIMWGHLEGHVDIALGQLTPLPYDQTAHCITANTDIRDKIEMLKGIAFLRKPSDAWFEEMLTTLNTIDNDLRPKRNRYVHDVWLDGDAKSTKKMTRKTIISKPQAFKRALSTSQLTEVGKDEVWDLVREIVLTTMKLGLLIQLRDEASEGPRPPKRRRAPSQ